MASQEVKTFSFAGDSYVCSCLEASLKAAGFALRDIPEADVVFTYCVSESALEDLYYDSKGLCSQPKRMSFLLT